MFLTSSMWWWFLASEGFPDSSVHKESACNARDPYSILRSGKSTGEGIPAAVFLGFPCVSAGKESACNVGDLGSIPGLGRFPGEGNGYPLQHSGLENSMDYTVHVYRSQIYSLWGPTDTTERLSVHFSIWKKLRKYSWVTVTWVLQRGAITENMGRGLSQEAPPTVSCSVTIGPGSSLNMHMFLIQKLRASLVA